MGELTVLPDDSGEKATPLEEPVPPPPPPVPPPPVTELVVEAKLGPDDGVWALNLGDETDCPGCWCSCKLECREANGAGVLAGEGAFRPPGKFLDELRTAEKVDVKGDKVEIPGPGLLDCGGPREETEENEERLDVASGVKPRRTFD